MALIKETVGGVVVERGPIYSPSVSEVEPFCSPTQGLLALFDLKGVKEEDILAAIAQIPDESARYTAQVALSRANPWLRNNETILQLAQLLGLTSQDLDNLFALAATIEV